VGWPGHAPELIRGDVADRLFWLAPENTNPADSTIETLHALERSDGLSESSKTLEFFPVPFVSVSLATVLELTAKFNSGSEWKISHPKRAAVVNGGPKSLWRNCCFFYRLFGASGLPVLQEAAENFLTGLISKGTRDPGYALYIEGVGTALRGGDAYE
jgi:hypothetical protein